MARVQRKYKGSLTLGEFELLLEAQEALFGELTKLEVLGGLTVGTDDESEFPPVSSALLPMIGSANRPAPAGATLLFDGQATILGQTMDVAAFRTLCGR
jgi:hypothetical protein